TTVMKHRYDPAGRQVARQARMDSLVEQMVQATRQWEAEHPPAGEARLASFRVLNRTRVKPASTSEADQILRLFAGYEPGSFAFADDGSEATLRYRGEPSLASRYGLVVKGKTGILLSESQ